MQQNYHKTSIFLAHLVYGFNFLPVMFTAVKLAVTRTGTCPIAVKVCQHVKFTWYCMC